MCSDTNTQYKSCPWKAFLDFLEYYINVYGGVENDDDCGDGLNSNKRKRERTYSDTIKYKYKDV